jgi:hypothetical protein|tara:strand:- start:538 stop:822 length:285 start_codon:yes stop_codon:yes gene_type:complete
MRITLSKAAQLEQAIAEEVVGHVIEWSSADGWEHFPRSVSELHDYVDANMVLFEVAVEHGLAIGAYDEMDGIAATVDTMLAATAADFEYDAATK